MKDLLVLAHPDGASLQASLAREARKRISAGKGDHTFTDLYGENFPCLLPLDEILRGTTTEEVILREQKALGEADRILLFYPDWWGMPPAVLKGWLDRVLATDVAYSWRGEDFLEKEWNPLLRGKSVHIFVTADGSLEESWLLGLWRDRIFGRCGAHVTLHLLDRLRERSHAFIQDWIEGELGFL